MRGLTAKQGIIIKRYIAFPPRFLFSFFHSTDGVDRTASESHRN
jgi:hypothetical protein